MGFIRIKEPLNGGLNTINDPEELSQGELSDAHNCHYLPGPGALQKARGRGSYAIVSASAVDVVGLRDTQFNNGDHYIWAACNNSLFYGPVADTGSFTNLTGATGAVSLENVQYNNRFYFLDGATPTGNAAPSAVNGNVVIYLSATAAGSAPQTRQHGMLPVNTAPTATTAGAGTFSTTTTGYYEYWCTEVSKYQQDGVIFYMEGTYDSKAGPTTVQISSTSVQPTIIVPGPRNANTTSWRIYRSAAKANYTDKLFPAGFQIAEISAVASATSVTQIQVVDSLVATASASALPKSWNIAPAKYSDMGNTASALVSADGVYGLMPIVGSPKWQGVYDFSNLGNNIYGNVAGIAIEIKCYVSAGSAPAPLQVVIGPNRITTNGDWSYNTQIIGGWVPNPGYHQGTAPVGKSTYITATAASQTITLGGSNDRWIQPGGQLWTINDLNSASTPFMVVLASPQQNCTIAVDYVKLIVYYGGTTVSTVAFPQVVYVFGDTSAQVGKNGPPPTSNTGDMFQDQLVVNDTLSPTTIRYSYPGDPDAFPSTYYIDFQTRENDVVRCIKNVNGRLVVWLDQSTWRLNYLPSERDASFDRGKSRESISSTYGAVNSMCVCTFSMADSPELAAFVSNQGIHFTDGFSFKTITNKIDWAGTVRGTTNYKPIALVNDRDRNQLLFYFQNDDYGTETFMCLPFCYHQSHLIYGMPKPGGLIHMRNYRVADGTYGDLKSAWSCQLASGQQIVYLGYGGTSSAAGAGKVYSEGTAKSFPAQDPLMSYKTRRIYPNGPGSESRVDEIYGYVPTYTGSPVVTYTPMVTKTNDQGEALRGSKTITLGGQRLHKIQQRNVCEGIRVSAQVSASAYSQEFLVLHVNDLGLEDSGR